MHQPPSDRLFLFRGVGNGEFSTRALQSKFRRKAGGIIVADVNADGLPDIVSDIGLVGVLLG